MTSAPATRRVARRFSDSRSDTRVSASSSEFSALEARLFTYLDNNLQEIKDGIKQQNEQMVKQSDQLQSLSMSSATRGELKELDRQVEKLNKDAGLTEQRLRSVESAQNDERKERKERPVQMWQVVVGGFAILAVINSCVYDFFLGIVQLVNLYLAFHH